jgi:uncharacterized membrane protein (UPF0127 family)
LRGLLGQVRMRSDEAVWIVPSRGIHTIGLRFAIDVIYLDAQLRVVHLMENLGPLRIAPIRWQCASVLELPARSLYGSGTQVGDQLLICSSEKMLNYWASQHPDRNSDIPVKDEPRKEAPPSATRRAI